MEVLVTRKPWKRCLVLGLILAASTRWCSAQEAAPGNAQQKTQPPAAGQPQAPPALPKALPGQPTPSTTQPPTAPQTLPALPAPPMPGPQQQPSQSDLAAAATGAQSLAGGSEFSSQSSYTMLGDQAPLALGIPATAFGPRVPGNTSLAALLKSGVAVPSVRGPKIADDENPLPQDRAYVNFNYFDDLNGPLNRALGVDVHSIQAYHELFGVEKTFFDGNASVGLRLPLNTLSTQSGLTAFDGASTDVGDLSVIFKYLLYKNSENGDVISGGLLVTAPTGPSAFAGYSVFAVPEHTTLLQPFVGYCKGLSENWFIHGFTSIEVPCGVDVTMLYNDVGIGYIAMRAGPDSNRFLTSIVPTFEVHVNTPLNHRGGLDPDDLLGTADVVDLTTGVTFEFNRRSTLAIAVAVPVTGPKPFDLEALAQFNLRFGASAPRSNPNVLQ
jgi:hypothetical protein